MGARRIESLRQQFATQGYVEFRTSPWKVSGFLLAHGSIIAIVIGAGFAGGPVGVAILGSLGLLLLAAVAWQFGVQLLGSGPPLRIDRDGVTFRCWNGPVELPWSDGIWLYAASSRGYLPQVAIQVQSSLVWKEHLARTSGHPWLDRWARRAGRREVRLPKVFDASTTDIMALVDADFLDSVGVEADGPRLLRDERNGVPVPILSPEAEALKDDVLALDRKRKAAEKAARREGRELTASEVAAFDTEAAAMLERHGYLPGEDS
ncbi:MAG: hypothetical protein ACJ72D_05270 [Marmoricola sp.]